VARRGRPYQTRRGSPTHLWDQLFRWCMWWGR